jgi:4-diphosphocytidyl-2-C-methyl-D-erythritol kinase
MTSIRRPAPAKINLALHVIGQRPDGYHLLDTLVAFAETGDLIEADVDDALTLTVAGPFAGALDTGFADNLVMHAATLLADEAVARGRPRPGARLRLTKTLPVASGVGGGSADAAATLIALNDLWQLGLDDARLATIGLQLGADVPMCLHGGPSRVTGIGEHVAPGPRLPDLAFLLIHPGVPVATPHVFRGLTKRDHAPMPDLPSAWTDIDHLIDWLEPTRNDLARSAEAIAPDIGIALELLRDLPGCRFARMSGSGATCFGIFADVKVVDAARRIARAARPDWWVG